MSTPNSNLDPHADDLFDARLRASYDAFGEESVAPPPPPGAWAEVAARLQPVRPPSRMARLRPLFAGLLGIFLGVLLMGWWGNSFSPVTDGEVAKEVSNVPGRVTDVPGHFTDAPGRVTDVPGRVTDVPGVITDVPGRVTDAPGVITDVPGHIPSIPATVGTAPAVAVGALASSESTPTVLVPLVQTETTLNTLAVSDSSRSERVRVLHTQRLELLALVRRNDSLLLALGEAVPVATMDSTVVPLPVVTPVKRWSVALSFAPERNFFGLSAPASDELSTLRRIHEQGRAGYNASLMAEYRLPGHNDRLSVAAGLGVSTYGAELRLTDRQTNVLVKTDTVETIDVSIRNHTTEAWQLPAPDVHLTPILNINGQVIGYDTVFIPRTDTTWTYITTKLIDTTITRTITPTITKREELTTRILRPNYRFLTLPLMVRYRIGRATDWTSSPTAPRWWADIAVGTQLQWFMGGTQLTTTDGRTYRTERVGMNEGPFRPFTASLTGSLSMSYALTQHLSASLSPTLRWQTESIYKASTGLTQRPTATGIQLGIRYSF
jgi:hypothetical protein